jgi:ATP-binding cassette subfamily B protein/subfamily B ATP-binding cassette protein MsbA
MLLSVGLGALQPWPIKLLVDHVLGADPLPASLGWLTALPAADSPAALAAWLAGSTVLLFALTRAAAITEAALHNAIGNQMAFDLGADLLDHLQRLSLRFHAARPRGDLVRRVMTDALCARELVLGVAMTAFASLASVGVMFAVMWKLDRSLAMVAVAIALPLGLSIRRFTRPMTERSYEHQELEGQILAHAEQTLSALPLVQSFGREDDETHRFRDLSLRSLTAYLRAITSQLRFKMAAGGVTALGTAVIMAWGGAHVLGGELTVGGLLVFLAYLGSLYAPVETLVYVAAGYGTAAARARRVFEILESEDGVQSEPGAPPLPRRPRGEAGQVRLEGVWFGYEPDRPVLEGIDLEARPGQTVALVGPTGAGKTTLVSLIARFFDPWRGRVCIDGVDLRRAALPSVRAQVALVLQEPLLLPLSVAENIAYGRPGATREEIVAAAVAANAHAFIERLPDGYDTQLGERGATLSGGERQRLSIARALLKDAPVLILDEPTSALDARTEALVLEALERLVHGRTTFLIAHRLSTVRHADCIAVLDCGRIVETGSHAELLARRGLYARLHRLQLGRPGAREARRVTVSSEGATGSGR